VTRRTGWAGRAVGRWVRRSRTRSPWLVHFDCGGCNGCDIEVLDTLTPRHSAERFGVVNVGDPRQADLLVVTGPANRRNAGALAAVFDQMAEPRAVVAVGSCAAHGGIFRGSPDILGGVGEVVPVDAFVPGCPPPPQAILDGILASLPALAAVRPDRRAERGIHPRPTAAEPPRHHAVAGDDEDGRGAPLPDCTAVVPAGLPDAARRLRDGGWRLMTATSIRRPAGWTVLYHFEREGRLRHLRVGLSRGERLPAIDDVYPAAFLVENEMRDLDDLPIDGLSIDYHGRLYRDRRSDADADGATRCP
jgi:ech hydrogenase subunit C